MSRPRLRSVRFMGSAPLPLTERWRLLGQDGGQSIALPDSLLFVFSDTLFALSGDPRARRGLFLANCAALTPGHELCRDLGALRYFTDEDGLPRELLVPSAEEHRRSLRFWPLHGVYLEGQVFLYYLGVRAVDPSTWGFRNVGFGLARLDPHGGSCQRLTGGLDWRWWPELGSDVLFGTQILRQEPYLYLFGSQRQGLSSRALLLRVTPDGITDPRAYQALSDPKGPRWTRHLDQAADLGPSATTFSVTWNPYLGRYLMLYIEEYEKQLTVRFSRFPWGPYSPPESITSVPHDPSSELVYMGFEHPELRRDKGRRIYLSYSQPRFLPNSLLTLCWQ